MISAMTMSPGTNSEALRPPTDALAAAPAGRPTREYRTVVAFVVSAVFIVVGLVSFGGSNGLGTRSSLFGPLLALVAYVVEANGLSRRRPWARYAMTPMLAITVVVASLAVLIAFGNGTWLIPIAGILALWAFTARPSESLGAIPSSSAEGALLVVGTALASIAPLIGL